MIGLGLGLVRQAVRNASGWTPAQLFTNGEQGVWYEPRPEYLYQDAAGTIAVTADGDPVGLMLDLSKGLELGPELVTNGTFDTDLGGWTISKDYWQWSAGRAYHPPGSEFNTLLSVDVSDFRGRSIEVKFDVEVLQGTIRAQFRTIDNDPADGGGPSGYPSGSTAGFNSGEYRFITTLPDDASFLGFARNNGDQVSEFYVDNVSIRELPGNHATQSTSAARPIYRTDGVLHWLEFDGVDDHLVLSANILRGEDGFVSLLWGSAVPLSLDDSIVFSNGLGASHGEHIGYNDGEYLRVYSDESTVGKSFGSRISADVNHIVSIKAGTSYSYGVNGDIYFDGTGERAYSQTINTIGISSGAQQIKGVYFGLVVVSKNIDEDTREKAEQYLAQKSGVTL